MSNEKPRHNKIEQNEGAPSTSNLKPAATQVDPRDNARTKAQAQYQKDKK